MAAISSSRSSFTTALPPSGRVHRAHPNPDFRHSRTLGRHLSDCRATRLSSPPASSYWNAAPARQGYARCRPYGAAGDGGVDRRGVMCEVVVHGDTVHRAAHFHTPFHVLEFAERGQTCATGTPACRAAASAARAFMRLCSPISSHCSVPCATPFRLTRLSEAMFQPSSLPNFSTGVQQPRWMTRDRDSSRPLLTTRPLPGTVRTDGGTASR